ncbi:hypothetical protein CMI37_13840 [Candidatus Pacearchaeota archaeon]|nr:hypothetical protein [Candidatus Pacearchaeota archaeon]
MSKREYASRIDKVGVATSHRDYSQLRHMSGLVPIPEPDPKWETIRAAKAQCASKCARFSGINGSCSLGRLPCRGCGFIVKQQGEKVDRMPQAEIEELMQPAYRPQGIMGVKIA